MRQHADYVQAAYKALSYIHHGVTHDIFSNIMGAKTAQEAWDTLKKEFDDSSRVKGRSSNSQLILSPYVDDLLLTGNDLKLLEQFKKVMMQEFAMIDLGDTKYFPGLEIQQLNKGIFICKGKYALDILKKFEMENCKAVANPFVQNEKLFENDQETKADSSYYRGLIGSLLCLTATRSDLKFAASYLSRFMFAPSKLHLVAAKRILSYIKRTYELGLWFDSNPQGRLQGEKEDVVTQSIAKVEYLVARAAANHAVSNCYCSKSRAACKEMPDEVMWKGKARGGDNGDFANLTNL
ncbi:hypothetical protein SLEP1_g59169 [Rubroshorea leprosula]|uniref:Reverse transcriptase Ty1/copia-type domain-containing protein n=1 Tax=Rubroshorea leprosula TaxID=152421 RepID=A0AAV5MUS0_9ROSI|nr:hypothetical protein SLEP1_g59169 [Rubroshorea leprosula]